MKRSVFPVMSLLALLAAIVGGAVFEVDRHRQARLDEAERHVRFQAMAFAESAHSTIDRISALLADLRSHWIAAPQAFAGEVDTHAAELGGLPVDVAVIDHAGRLAFSSRGAPKSMVDLADREYFGVHRASGSDRLHLSPPQPGRHSGRPHLLATRPIFADGRFRGVVVAVIAPEALVAFHDRLALGPAGASLVGLESGAVLAVAPDPQRAAPHLAAWIADRNRPSTGNLPPQVLADGVERVVGYQRIAEHGLVVFVAESVEHVMAAHDEYRRKIYGYAGALGLLVLLSGWQWRRMQFVAARSRDDLVESLARERLLGAAVRQSDAAIVMTDAAGTIVYVNDAFERTTGYSREEAIGQNPRILKSGLIPDATYKELWTTITGGGTWQGELQNQTRDGRPYWESANISPVVDDAGRITHFIAVKENITRRKELERVLEDARRELDTAQRVARIGSWSIDVRTGALHWSDEAYRLFGLTPGRPVDLVTFIERLHPEDRTRVLDAWADAIAGTPYDIEHRIDRDGEVLWVRERAEIMRDASGTAVSAVGTVQDITGLKLAERRRALLESALDQVEEAAYLVREDASIEYANAGAAAQVGWPAAELCRMRVFDIDPDLAQPDWPAHWAELRARGSLRVERMHRHRQGGTFPVEVSANYVEVDGQAYNLALVRDITARLAVEAGMREALAVFKASGQGIMTTDRAGAITSVNPAFTAITGFSPAEVIGQNPSILKSGLHDEAFYRDLWETTLKTGRWEGEIWNCRRSGEIYPQWMVVSAVRDAAGETTGFVSVFNDITERKRKEEDIWRQANFDALTGLPNRRLLMDRLKGALGASQRTGSHGALMFIDLDNFKPVNDRYGHAAGDDVLLAVARRLGDAVREVDTVSRLGGDEFVVLLGDLGTDFEGATMAARLVAEKVQAMLAHPHRIAVRSSEAPDFEASHSCTASIGVVLFRGHAVDAEDLFAQADAAMYASKMAGRNAIRFFDPVVPPSGSGA